MLLKNIAFFLLESVVLWFPWHCCALKLLKHNHNMLCTWLLLLPNSLPVDFSGELPLDLCHPQLSPCNVVCLLSKFNAPRLLQTVANRALQACVDCAGTGHENRSSGTWQVPFFLLKARTVIRRCIQRDRCESGSRRDDGPSKPAVIQKYKSRIGIATGEGWCSINWCLWHSRGSWFELKT